MRKALFSILIFYLALGSFQPAFAAEPSKDKPEILFFYSQTCPHCIAEQKFLDKVEEKCPGIVVGRHVVSDEKNRNFLQELLKEGNNERYFGVVPLTFIGKELFVGFDNEKGVGKSIIKAMQENFPEIAAGCKQLEEDNGIFSRLSNLLREKLFANLLRIFKLFLKREGV